MYKVSPRIGAALVRARAGLRNTTFFCSYAEQSRTFLVSRPNDERSIYAARPPCGPFSVPAWPVLVLRGITLPDRRSSKRGGPGNGDNGGKKVKDEAMGTARRAVYHNAGSEPVPDEMLDLLRKLG